MKSFKGMNRVLGSMKRRPSPSGAASAHENRSPEFTLDSPEANAARSVKLFCESGGPNNSGDEVLHLPTIVEAAESSPAAAKECADQVRKFLAVENVPYVQYNAVMLMRILSDNPGTTFTRNIDKKFVETLKNLLKLGRDPSVQQILRETLDNWETEKKQDETLARVLDMWSAAKVKMMKTYGPSSQSTSNRTSSGPRPANNQNYFARQHSSRHLPSPEELASRIEEAKTSAKLLTQLVQSTPPAELLGNDLVREFADRCLSASRSVQSYMVAENPGPDNDTMLTLIETNEQLALAMSKHHRAILQARKVLGVSTQSSSPSNDISGFAPPPPGPPPESTKPAAPLPQSSAAPPPAPPTKNSIFSKFRSDPKKVSPLASAASDQLEDPFKDPTVANTHNQPFSQEEKASTGDQFNERLGAEPYHPGFNPTHSYMGRQEEATGNLSMTAAVPAASGSREVAGNDRRDDEDDEDAYSATPERKAPIYRY